MPLLQRHSAPIALPFLLASVLFSACSDDKESVGSDGGSSSGGTSSSGGSQSATGGTAQAGTGASGGSTSVAGSSGSGGSGLAAGGAPTGGSAGAGATGSGGVAANSGAGGSAGVGGSAGASTDGGSSSGGTSDAGSSPGGGPAGTAGSAGSSSVACPTATEETFSFFLASQRALIMDSGNPDGYGGDLGGIAGADAICQRIAESVSPCQSGKVWHAFLSTSTENAIDRIGSGPWYDRTGRLFGTTVADLILDRPAGDEFFSTDVATEDGSPSRNPNGTGNVDNHQTLTGSGADGKVYTQDAEPGRTGADDSCGGEDEWTQEKATCWDWTSSEPAGCPRVGHSWPRPGSGINWLSVWNEGGCSPGGSTDDTGGLDGTRTVGSGGGYGGFYCFAVID